MVHAETCPLPGWAHSCGLITLGPPVPPKDAAAVHDRMIFSEMIARYCWSYDERRLDQLGACFADDAVWEGSVLGQVAIGPFRGRESITAWLSEFWPHQKDQRRHMLLNTIVEAQSENEAATLSYLLLMSSTGEEVRTESMGFYRTAYRKQGDAWKISRLTAGFDKPFWPGALKDLSSRGRTRHGIGVAS